MKNRLLSSFRAVFRKEILHIRRDRRVLMMAVMLPIMQMTLFGFIDQTVHDVPTVVVDQDHSVASRDLIDKLRATKTFEIIQLTENPHIARTAIISGKAGVGIVIPPDYRDQRARGLPAKILVLIDGSNSTISAGALAAVNGLMAQENIALITQNARAVGMPVAAQPIILFNPEGRTPNFIIPGLIAIILQIVAVMLASGAIVREKEEGTFEQLMVTPVQPLALMVGKVTPYLGLGVVETAFALALMRFVFGVPIHGNVIFLIIMSMFYLASLLALGLFISTRAKTQQEAQQLAQFTILPSIFLSGYIFPIPGLPWLMRGLSALLPPTHMIEIMRGVILRDAGPIEMLPHVLALIGFAVVMVWLSLRHMKKIVG